jgi:hypothetical protein
VPLTLAVGIALALMVSGRIELAGIAVGLATASSTRACSCSCRSSSQRGSGGIASRWECCWRSSGSSRRARSCSSTGTRRGTRRGTCSNSLGTGWLGFEHDHAAPIAFVVRLWDGLGPVLIICVLGLVVAFVRRSRTDLILGSFVVVYFLDLLTLRAHFGGTCCRWCRRSARSPAASVRSRR